MKNKQKSLFRKDRVPFLKMASILFLAFVLITPQSWASQQESRIITGKIVDALSNESLPGATIIEKGTTNGSVTDIDGKFSLEVGENSTIVISYISFKTIEIATKGKQYFDIAMEADVVGVEDVVVIGYGTVKKSDLTGAVASIDADDIRSSVGSGIDQALQGRTAGVTVTANSGAPGAAPTIRIRGTGTVNNSDPFFVIDGIPVSQESAGLINPGDIESIEILKDASASAIYGARAANGVVLITTRRAKEGKSNIIIDAYTGVQSLTKKYEIMDAEQWVTIRNAAGQSWQDSSTVTNTDWQDEVFRQAPVKNLQISFLNGSSKVNSAIIGSYFQQDGIIKGSDYERYTLRVNTTSKIKPWLTVGENFSIAHSTRNIIPEQNEWVSVAVQTLTMDPSTPVYNEDGTHAGSLNNNISNPVGVAERNHNKLNTNQLLGNAYIEIKPLSWLSFKTSVGAEVNYYENEQFTPIYYESVSNNNNTTQLYNGDFKFNSMIFEQLLTINKTFAEKHDIQAIIGYTNQKSSYRLDMRSIGGVSENEDLWFISNGEASTLIYEDIQANLPALQQHGGTPYDASMISYFGRIMYSFDGKYDITSSVRRDGSSKFGAQSRFGIFPSFAAGWKINEESFFPKNNILDFAKVRAGWGKLGNQEIGNYGSYLNVSYGYNYTYGTYGNQTTYPGGAPTGFANAALQWESTNQINIGLDMRMFNSKLDINFDYFNRLTQDMLTQVPSPGITGILVDPYANAGEVSNKGWELNASYRERENDFKWEVGFNLGHVKNNVEKLGEEGATISSAAFRGSDNISRTEVGMPIAYFYGFVTDGIYQNQEEIDADNKSAQDATDKPTAVFDNRKAQPGDIRYKDVDNDGKITSKDKDFIGSPHPDLTYGININVEYKGIDFKVFGQGVYGNEIFMSTIYYLQSGDGYWNLLQSTENYWEQEGDITDVPRLGQNSTNMRLSDRYVKDGSFFRIKNIQLGYTLPNTISEKVGLESARIYISGQNLITFHTYEGFDPEIGTNKGTNSPLDIGIDRGMYPTAKTISVGINLKF